METGDLVAEVAAPAAGLRVRLYLTPGRLYRLRVGSGIGWAPGAWRTRAEGMARLLACQSYGPAEAEMLRKMCRQAY